MPWMWIAALAGTFVVGRASVPAAGSGQATNWQLAIAVAAGALGGFLLGKATK